MSTLRTATRALSALLCLSALAAAQPPPVPGVEPGRALSGDALTFCTDPRNPTHELEKEIAAEIARALLLEPSFYTVERSVVTDAFDNVYLDLRDDCEVYPGFQVIANSYANWVILTRAYYQARYVLVVADPGWDSLDAIPGDRPIALVPGSVGDIRLIQLLRTRSPGERWPRYPKTSTEAALEALRAGEVGAVLLWEPQLWALARQDPTLADLRVLAPSPISEPPVGVGALLRADESFLQTMLDGAIASLIEDGVIDEILTRSGFPASAPAP